MFYRLTASIAMNTRDRMSMAIALFLGLSILTSLILINPGTPVEAGARGNHIDSKFELVANPMFTPGDDDLSGSGKFAYDPKKGEFDITVEAEGLEPGELYNVTATIREGKAGGVPAVAKFFNVAVVADDNGKIKVTRKHRFLELLNEAPGDGSNNWRIDQQIRLAGVGDVGTVGGCVDCILVCSPTTKISLVDGELVEGWLP